MAYPDLLIHVDTGLAAEAGRQLAEEIQAYPGIVEARFSPSREHLIHVWYDPEEVPAAKVVAALADRGHEARLVAL